MLRSNSFAIQGRLSLAAKPAPERSDAQELATEYSLDGWRRAAAVGFASAPAIVFAVVVLLHFS